MKYLCLLTVLLMLPANAAAQPFDSAQGGQRRNDRQSNDRGAEQRGADRAADRQSDQRQSGQRSTDRRSDDRRATDRREVDHRPAAPRAGTPWWERQQLPWWEGGARPSWEKEKQTPAWQTMNPARTLLDRQREQRQRDETIGGRNHRPYWRGSPGVIIVPQYRFFEQTLPATTQFVVTPPPPTQAVTYGAPEPPLPPAGILTLDVEPKEPLQIYVDGVFVGTPADLGDELALTVGTHRIELRARGYKTITFTAEIQENRTISYRGVLDRDETAPAPPPQTPILVKPAGAPGATTMYLIPGCYLGNVEPRAEQLRPGCDISKLTKFTP